MEIQLLRSSESNTSARSGKPLLLLVTSRGPKDSSLKIRGRGTCPFDPASSSPNHIVNAGLQKYVINVTSSDLQQKLYPCQTAVRPASSVEKGKVCYFRVFVGNLRTFGFYCLLGLQSDQSATANNYLTKRNKKHHKYFEGTRDVHASTPTGRSKHKIHRSYKRQYPYLVEKIKSLNI